MLRLHRVGIGMFAATFGLIAAGLIVGGEDDPFAKLTPKKGWKAVACDIVELRGRDERVDGSPR
jgi:Na+/glutamate symporter